MVRVSGFLAWTFLLLPLQVCALLVGSRISWRIPRLYHQGNCFLLGLKVVEHGALNKSPAVLFVSNHSSYLDIIVLAALTEACFISKIEVAAWPLFGILAKLNHTVFVKRRVRESGEKLGEIKDRLKKGQRLILFPEGTSSDGNRVLPFNSTFFAAGDTEFDGAPIKVQPVAIAYTKLWGLPLGRGCRPARAWYGDMSLAGHLWSVFKSGPTEVEVAFLPCVRHSDFASRKELSKSCEATVASALSEILKGDFRQG
tara:strand:- start:1174 stop:1941 length:768 start_codon:yes stop_codon:yes gene_type:complete